MQVFVPQALQKGRSKSFDCTNWESYEIHDLEKRNVFHRVVSAVACPEFQIVDRRCCGDQRVSQFNSMTFRELSQVVPREYSNFRIDGDAMNRGEQRFERAMLPGARAMPELCDRDWRAQESRLTPA